MAYMTDSLGDARYSIDGPPSDPMNLRSRRPSDSRSLGRDPCLLDASFRNFAGLKMFNQNHSRLRICGIYLLGMLLSTASCHLLWVYHPDSVAYEPRIAKSKVAHPPNESL